MYIHLLHRQPDPVGLNSWLTYYADTGTLIAVGAGETLHAFALPSAGWPAGNYAVTLSERSAEGLATPGQYAGCIRTVGSLPHCGLVGNPRLDIRLMPGAGWDRLVQMLSRAGGGKLEVRSSTQQSDASMLLPAVQAAREAARRAQWTNNLKQ